jgi:eukaryotic-like serine/threonine-protein kinase
MTQFEWEKIAVVFELAVAKPADGQQAFIRSQLKDHQHLVDVLLSMLSHHIAESNGSGGEASAFLLPQSRGGALCSDRFEVKEQLGIGAFGSVYRAHDKESDSEVAIKLLHDLAPKSLYRFKQEFRRLTNVEHPNIVVPYELFHENGRWFFTMQLVEGEQLVDFVRRGIKSNSSESISARDIRLRSTFLQLASALHCIHQNQLVHGDIKPANVLVSGEGMVHVLDFGLTHELTADSSLSKSILAGTPLYMAPEQIDGSEVSQSADWYSLGVMLYEALFGKNPFCGSYYQVLSSKCNEDVIPPLIDSIAEDFSDLCACLLSRNPQSRPGFDAIKQTLSQGCKSMGSEMLASAIGFFVGRHSELEELSNIWGEVKSGRPICVHVLGSSGVGKTTLLREFTQQVRKQSTDCVILKGRCYQQASVSFKALDEVVDGLAGYLGRLDASVLTMVLPQDIQPLAVVFPVLRAFVPLANVQPIPDLRAEELRRLAIAALVQLLGSLGGLSPLILWIDDLQWGDEDSVLILKELMRQANPPLLLLLLSYRTEDIADNSILQAVRAHKINGARRELMLSPFNASTSLELIRSIRPDYSHKEMQTIAAESGGSPLFIRELVGAYSSELGEAPLLRSLVADRVSSLDGPVQELIHLIAVAGQPVSRKILYRAAGLKVVAQDFWRRQQARRLLRVCGPTGADLDVYHDAIRDIILSGLLEPGVGQYHLRLALAMEEDSSAEPERLMRHFACGGDLRSALRYCSIAVDSATACLAFGRAATLLKRALELQRMLGISDREPNSDGRRTRLALAEALSSAGLTTESADVFLELAAHDTDPDSVDYLCQAADQMLRGGSVDEGLRLLRRALADLDLKIPSRRTTLLASIVATRTRVRICGYNKIAKKEVALASSVERRLERLWGSGVTLTATDPMVASLIRGHHYLAAMHSGSVLHASLALSLEAVQTAMTSGRERSEDLLVQAQFFAELSNNDYARSMCLLGKSGAAFFHGDMKASFEIGLLAEESLRAEHRGVTWDLSAIRTLYLGALSLMGRHQEYSVRLKEALSEAEMTGNVYARFALPLSTGYYTLLLAADLPEQARIKLDEYLHAWNRTEFDFPHFSHWYGTIEADLYEGRFPEAWQKVQRSWPELRRSFLLSFRLQGLLARQLRARTALALYRQRPSRELRNEVLEFLSYCNKSSVAVSKAWSAVLEAGLAACNAEKPRAAHLLRGARELFRSLGYDSWAAATRFAIESLTDPISESGTVNVHAEAIALGIRNPAAFFGMLVIV